MTPQEVLAQALHDCGEVYADCRHREDEDDVAAGLSLVRVYRDCGPTWHMEKAAAILAAVPEGWALLNAEGAVMHTKATLAKGAQQERERLRNVWDGWLEFGMPPDVQQAIDSGDTPHVVWRLLTADPEDTP